MVSGRGGPLAMKKNRLLRKKRKAPKTILRLPDLDHAKAAVLNSLTCSDAQRGYRHAIDEFIDWYCSEPRLAFGQSMQISTAIANPKRPINSAGNSTSNKKPSKPRMDKAYHRVARVIEIGEIATTFVTEDALPRLG
jgi:hypothetical protein